MITHHTQTRAHQLRQQYRDLHRAGAHKDARSKWRELNRIVHEALAERDMVEWWKPVHEVVV